MGQSTHLENIINYSGKNFIHKEDNLDIWSSIPSERKVDYFHYPIIFVSIELYYDFKLERRLIYILHLQFKLNALAYDFCGFTKFY